MFVGVGVSDFSTDTFDSLSISARIGAASAFAEDACAIVSERPSASISSDRLLGTI